MASSTPGFVRQLLHRFEDLALGAIRRHLIASPTCSLTLNLIFRVIVSSVAPPLEEQDTLVQATSSRLQKCREVASEDPGKDGRGARAGTCAPGPPSHCVLSYARGGPALRDHAGPQRRAGMHDAADVGDGLKELVHRPPRAGARKLAGRPPLTRL